MPEYLAPSVFVEETSFRSKPLEGVSTSTSAFVGPTLTGPLATGGGNSAGLTPELLTSAGDFERLFGSTGDLQLSDEGRVTNYLAHAVRAFFDNGGRRLYVVRAYHSATPEADRAGSVNLTPTLPFRTEFVGRFPGSAGNGRVDLFETTTPASVMGLAQAPSGTLLRTGTNDSQVGAELRGGIAPFQLQAGSSVVVRVSGEPDAEVTFQGTAAAATATDALPDTVTFTEDDNRLVVTVDGFQQELSVPAGAPLDRQAILNALQATVGAHVSLDGDRLVFTSDAAGTASAISVSQSDAFGFTQASTLGVGAGGNVPNLNRVSLADLQTLLPATVSIGERPGSRQLVLTTVATGTGVTLSVADPGAGVSARTALGLPATVADGSGANTVTYFVKRGNQWQDDTGGTTLPDPDQLRTLGAEFVSFSLVATDANGLSKNFDDLHFDPEHPRYVGLVLGLQPPRRADQLENRFALALEPAQAAPPHTFAFRLRETLLPLRAGAAASNGIPLTGGSDGAAPTGAQYRQAFEQLRAIEDISIVATPGSAALGAARDIQDQLLTHVSRARAYEIAVLDAPRDQTPSSVRTFRADIDSKYAALYYPWVRVANPDVQPGNETIPRELLLPPSGFVCGIYARNDAERGVFKAPANEIVRGALGFEINVNFAEQESLNPSGVNALRFFPGRGNRVWGARLASSDPEWKYVSDRRYFNYLEASIDGGTQWVVFEPNGPRLWSRVRNTITDFLYNEWRSGALLGETAGQAYFVRCDRSTMTQNDLDNGRLICEIGVAIVRPAEFVIFRIGQKTADARS